jgi:lipopolysaccharide biosynthesis glycosyltransferase
LNRVFIGYDSHEKVAFDVACLSLRSHSRVDIQPVSYRPLIIRGLYDRHTVTRNGRLWDIVSNAPMSTQHAIARFFIPFITERKGWVLFTDGDVLFRRDVAELFRLADPTKALMVVQHDYWPLSMIKKTGDAQMLYARKNWSSVMLWNLEHPAHDVLTLEQLNTLPGRDLHRFCWLENSVIGGLPMEWNWLVGHSPLTVSPAIVHFTEGVPDVIGHECDPFASEWHAYAEQTPSYQWKRVTAQA